MEINYVVCWIDQDRTAQDMQLDVRYTPSSMYYKIYNKLIPYCSTKCHNNNAINFHKYAG